jgi:hypothetical protein
MVTGMRSSHHRRIGDDDRERASTELRARWRDGLIGHDDFLARLERVWRASRACELQRAVAPERVSVRAGRAAGPR